MAFRNIQEYITRGQGTAGTLLIPKLIMPVLIEEVEKVLIPRECAAMVIGPSQIQGSSFNFNLGTPNTMSLRGVGEGASIPMDSIDFTNVTFTPKKYGVAIRITREMIEDSQFEILQQNLMIAARRFAEKENSLILTALDGANSTVAGGAAITIGNIAEAMYNVENQDFVPTDIIAGNRIIQNLRNIDTFVEADKSGNTEMLTRGFIGTLFGMNVVRFSSNAAPSTIYAQYAYVLDRRQAYAIALKRDLTVENFDLPSYDMEGAALTFRIDIQLLRSKAVTKITTA
jgi:HK97 family phage major capsid protein